MLEIKPYKDTQKQELFSFTKECFEQLNKQFEPNGRHKAYNDINTNFERFWCLTDNNKIKGTVAITKLNNQTAELKALYLDPNLRGQGWGYKLLNEAVTYAKQQGYKRIVLDSMTKYKQAQKLYQRYGFTPTDRYNDNPYADVFMEMRLG